MGKKCVFISMLIFTFLSITAMASPDTPCKPIADLSHAPNGEIKLYPVSNNRVEGYEGFIADPKKPTLILLPGVYRGALSNDETLVALTAKKINWISIHLSAQPMSVDRGLTFKATFDDITSKVFKKEIRSLVKDLCIQTPVYGGLSYSETIATLLTTEESPLVIHTTPMGTFTDGLPDEGMSYTLAEFWYSLNPFAYMGWDALKEANYRVFWRQAINDYIVRYPAIGKDSVLKDVAVSGYTSMSRAIEYFDLRKTNYSKGPQRIFILAQNEDKGRKKIQLQALAKATTQMGKQPLTFIIKDSSHNVMTDAPLAWARTLEFSLNNEIPQSSVAYVEKDGSFTWLTNQEWEAAKAELIRK